MLSLRLPLLVEHQDQRVLLVIALLRSTPHHQENCTDKWCRTIMPVMQFRTFKQGAPAVNTSSMALFGQGFKPGGGTWADSSDVRIKNIVGPYPHGLAELLEMLPQMFTYKGNDQMVKPDGTPGDVIHPDTVTQHIGLIAQECEPYMPELVTQTTAYVDGVLVNDVRQLDATGVIYALVNAVAELHARLAVLEAAR